MTVGDETEAALATVADGLAAAALAMAKRFATGATLWCLSTRWPAHARHVAVEFVHPVIVGKRALPAVSVAEGDLVTKLRLLVRPGDIVLAIGPADDRDLASVVRRAEPWGALSVWIGAGAPRPTGEAHHVLWIDGLDLEVAARAGSFVVLYHLLWELTHVVFEHPGLLAAPGPEGEVCITCSDAGTVAEVAELDGEGKASVLAGGHRESVDTTLVGPVGPGDLVLVHAGTAITILEGGAE